MATSLWYVAGAFAAFASGSVRSTAATAGFIGFDGRHLVSRAGILRLSRQSGDQTDNRS
jgi:hypothetical protein